MKEYACTLLTFVAQIRVYHWQTQNYAAHKALGDLYDGISGLADEFIEAYIGAYDRASTSATDEISLDFNPANAVKCIKRFQSELVGWSEDIDDSDLLNIRDEMTALLKKTLYLLTLGK